MPSTLYARNTLLNECINKLLPNIFEYLVALYQSKLLTNTTVSRAHRWYPFLQG